jgi:hypothetical protein
MGLATMTKTYTHELNREIRSISGRYELDREERVRIAGHEILYAVGNAMVDSSCCGMWGCRFALVPGVVIQFKCKTDSAQNPVSIVEPLRDEAIRKAIARHLEETEGVTQVRFWE